jgi:uncharacterized protein with NRDE domain
VCLILLATDADPRYSLVVAANRDESYARPTAGAGFWNDEPHIYGGRDLEQHGTWLAISRHGRFAAITNYRAGEPRTGVRSRGELTRGFLAGSEQALPYLEQLSRRADEYSGFSLVAGEPGQLYFFSNRGGAVQPIGAGVHGLSNHLLDEPWPKVQHGKVALAGVLSSSERKIVGALHAALADRTPAADALLPSTGVGMARERDLSPAFIAADRYGTRASTVVLVSREGEVVFSEKTFGPHGKTLGETEERFGLYSRAKARRGAAARA